MAPLLAVLELLRAAEMDRQAPIARPQQEGRPRQPRALRVHREGHPEGQGDQALYRPQHRRGVGAPDIKDASCIEGYQLPKIYIKQFYSVEAAIHQRVVRVRSVEARKIREPPQRARPAFNQQAGGAGGGGAAAK